VHSKYDSSIPGKKKGRQTLGHELVSNVHWQKNGDNLSYGLKRGPGARPVPREELRGIVGDLKRRKE